MSLNKYFKRSEFACKCGCGLDTVDVEMLKIVTEIREHFNAPTVINSACRCKSHNESVGGGVHSQHLIGRAADIVVKGVSTNDVHSFIVNRYPDSIGVGKYDTFTHVDSRDTKARW